MTIARRSLAYAPCIHASPENHVAATAAQLDYAATPDSDGRVAWFARRIGIAMLIALLALAAIELCSVIAVVTFDYGSPRVVPALFVYLVYFTTNTAIAVVALRRTGRAQVPPAQHDVRIIVRSWLWLGALRLLFLGAYTLVAYLTSDYRAATPTGNSAMMIVRTVAYAFEAVLPMLVVPLIVRRRTAIDWIRPLASLFLAFAIVRATIELMPLVTLAVSEESMLLHQYLRSYIGRGALLNPLVWLLVATIAAGVLAIRPRPDRRLLVALVIGAFGWLGCAYRPDLRIPRASLISLLGTAYTLYNALLSLAPAWILGWLAWHLTSQRGRGPLLAEPVDAPT